MNDKILYFEGAGWNETDCDQGIVANHRIRTAFRLDNGRSVYLEILKAKKLLEKKRGKKQILQCYGSVDSLHYITDDIPNDDCNRHRLSQERESEFKYTCQDILAFVNNLGASFNAVEVVPYLGGYYVFRENYHPKGTERFNYSDEFQFDPDLTARRKAVYEYVYQIEAEEWKKDRDENAHQFVHIAYSQEYPNFSLWVDHEDSGMLHLLRHYNGYNRHWTIRIDTASDINGWMQTAAEIKLGRYGC